MAKVTNLIGLNITNNSGTPVAPYNTLAVGSVTLTAGSVGGSGTLAALTTNSVDVLATTTYTFTGDGTNTATGLWLDAQGLSAQINAHTGTTGYTAAWAGGKVANLQAPVGSGSTQNGKAVTSTVGGDATATYIAVGSVVAGSPIGVVTQLDANSIRLVQVLGGVTTVYYMQASMGAQVNNSQQQGQFQVSNTISNVIFLLQSVSTTIIPVTLQSVGGQPVIPSQQILLNTNFITDIQPSGTGSAISYNLNNGNVDMVYTVAENPTQINGLFAPGAVTQITSQTTGVTLNTTSGVITTFSLSTASASTTTFVLTDSNITTASKIAVNILSYAGTTGNLSSVTVGTIGSGTAQIVLHNTSGSAALNGVATIFFSVSQ